MRSKYEYRSSSREVYARFCKKYPEVKLSYLEWCNIIYSFNCGFRDYCLETGLKAKFPYGIGEFCITRYKPNKFKKVKNKNNEEIEVVNLNINWKKTKEKGFRVYHLNAHTEGFDFRWYWVTGTPRFFQSGIWSFKPSRVSSRLINHYITQGYKNKYQEWKR